MNKHEFIMQFYSWLKGEGQQLVGINPNHLLLVSQITCKTNKVKNVFLD